MAERIFLGRNQLPAEAVAEHLAAFGAESRGCADFRRVAVVVPGMAARHALQQSLLKRFPALLPPKIWLPSQLLHCGAEKGRTPSALETELLWSKTLEAVSGRAADFPALFPGGAVPEKRRFPERIFAAAYREVSAGGFSIAEAAEKLGEGAERWTQLAELEKIYLEHLKECGFDDPLALEKKSLRRTSELEKFDRIVLGCVPDLPRMLREKLRFLDEKDPARIQVWIHALDEERDAFDEWGVPIPEKWLRAGIRIAPGDLILAADAADAARRAVREAAGSGVFVRGEWAVALTDPSFAPAFTEEFSRCGQTRGAPLRAVLRSGVPVGKKRIASLLGALLEYLQNPDDFASCALLLTNEDYLLSRVSGPADADRLLAALDEFRTNCFPDEVAPALKILAKRRKSFAGDCEKLYRLLGEIAALPEKWEKCAVSGFLRDFLHSVYRGELAADRAGDEILLSAEIEFFRDHLAELDDLPEALLPDREKTLFLESFLRHCGTATLPVQGAADLTLEGALEIPFLSENNVIFCGLNEKYYPDRLPPGPFLNDTLRKKIGLRNDDETYCRALCHLKSLVEPRPAGSVRLIVLKESAEHEALKPSPLLFSGDLSGDELLSRCRKLYADPAPLAPHRDAPASGAHFFLSPAPDYPRSPDGKVLMSVTDFAVYLADPVQFYFSRVLHAEPCDYALAEPDARLFGTICHEAFENARRRFRSVEETEAALKEQLDRILRRDYGEELPVLIRLQRDNLFQRLKYGAELLFQEQLSGFEVLETEYAFHGPDGGRYIPFGKGCIRGKTDRIEYCPRNNTLRILDIKTGKIRENSVEKEHLASTREDPPRFRNLQLPLYALLLKQDPFFRARHTAIDWEKVNIECGYWLLPAAVTESRLALWPSSAFAKILPCAQTCAVAVIDEVADLVRGIFRTKPKTGGVFKDMLLPDLKTALPSFSFIEPRGDEEEDHEKL